MYEVLPDIKGVPKEVWREFKTASNQKVVTNNPTLEQLFNWFEAHLKITPVLGHPVYKKRKFYLKVQ